MPCIQKNIEQFVIEHNCKDEVMAYFDCEASLELTPEKKKEKPDRMENSMSLAKPP